MSEPPDAESVAARLRFLRGSLGLSQEQLARRLGVSFATVNRWESGRTQLSPRALTAQAELEAEVAERSAVGSGPGRDSSGGNTSGGSGGGGSSSSSSSRADQLPVARSSFVGRASELAELAALVSRSRLVTLIGPGGAGKTRLATELLSRDFADADVVFVPLEQIRDPRALPSALASRLRVHDQPGAPLIDSIRDALAASPRLLLLDGAERLADQVAELVSVLLASVPTLRVTVTSRAVLGIQGEICWTVPPLACPSVTADASDIAASDAVQLFIARASERLPDFRASDIAPHAIAELCRRLDGLPLAIELIAGWVGTLSIREILQQRAVLLATEPALAGQHRGRKLADVLHLSYDLLGPDQRRMTAMLSVFAGSFGLPDMQAVLGLDEAAAASTARLLVDSSWLEVSRSSEQNLFGMLETIRSFAAHQLDRADDGPAVRRRHALHLAELAIASEGELAGPDAARWASRMEAAVPDLDAALQWADDNGDVDLGLDASAALWRWWLISGRLAVGRTWLARFLATAGQRLDERTGRAHCATAILAAENGDYAEAIRAADIALRIFEPLGRKDRIALAATVLGSAHRYLGDHAAARRSFEKVMELSAELSDSRMAAAINNFAVKELDDGELDHAQQLFEQALVIKRRTGVPRSIAIGLVNLADVLIRKCRWDDADSALREAAVLAASSPTLTSTVRCGQGNLAAGRRNWAQATEHYRAAISSGQAGGHPDDVIEAMIGLSRVCRQTDRAAEAAQHLRDAQDLAERIASPRWRAEVRAALAELAGAAAAPLPGNLTRRQAEVLTKLAAGLTNKQIAAELYLSPATVERHLATIYAKLGLSGRVDAARYAIEHGLAEPPPAIDH